MLDTGIGALEVRHSWSHDEICRSRRSLPFKSGRDHILIISD
jgi:hypothetical protein